MTFYFCAKFGAFITKCTIVMLCHCTNITIYQLNSQNIKRVKSAKYLVSHNMSWSNHISKTVGWANSALALFCRNFGQCTQDVKAVLEYVAVIWSFDLNASRDKSCWNCLVIIRDIQVLQPCYTYFTGKQWKSEEMKQCFAVWSYSSNHS